MISVEQLVLGPRPGKKSVPKLADLGLSHCITLLSEREGAPAIGRIATRFSAHWLWLPIEGGSFEHLSKVDFESYVDHVFSAAAQVTAPKLYIHCSAGIHRTGAFAYALLRQSGLCPDPARRALATLRPVTGEQVGEARLDLVDTILDRAASAP